MSTYDDSDDLYVVNLPDREKPGPPTNRHPRRSWKQDQHVRTLRQGGTDWDGQFIADLCESLVGPGIRTRHEEALMEQLMRRMSDGTAAVRRFKLHGPPPPRVKGKLHLSPREQQVGRDVMAKGEDRGPGCYLPFVPRFIKKLPYDGAPLSHGWIVLERGMDFLLIDGSARRVRLDEWPELPKRGRGEDEPTERGVPLILGNGDARSVWEHLAAGPGAGFAVWQEGQPNLFVVRLLGDECFADPLEVLRQRAQGA